MDCDVSKLVLKKRRLAASNSKWRVYLDHIADRQGHEIEDYLVVEGQHTLARHVTGVAVLPILDGKFALFRSYRHPISEEIWELPRGTMDENETTETAALRELAEETGLSCDPEHLVSLGIYIPDPGTMATRAELFAATRCVGKPRLPSDEIGLNELKLIEQPELDRLVASGEIEDAATLIAYYRYRELSGTRGR